MEQASVKDTLCERSYVIQYQLNSRYRFRLNGVTWTSRGDIDEAPSSWLDRNGTQLAHSTIDDDESILNVIKNSFEAKVSR